MRVLDAYFNLHKHAFSLKAITGAGKVIGHRTRVVMQNVDFRVQPGGRARVIAEGKKNVHAFVRGQVIDPVGQFDAKGRPIGIWRTATYNPYLYDSFVDTITAQPVTRAQAVILNVEDGKGRIYYRAYEEAVWR